VVTARRVEVGNLATPRSPLLELAAGEALLLRVPVSELDVVHLSPGDAARISVDALPEAELLGRIARIFPAADSASRQVTVEIRVTDAPAAVLIGFLARAELVLEERPGSLLVPEGAVLRGADVATFVWTVEGEVARMRPVEVGLRLEGAVLIEEGLAAGDEVVVEGLARLRDGARVRRTEALGSAS
jgi:RND family efflux transporter MFP subunit